jgi:hypothetical protein
MEDGVISTSTGFTGRLRVPDTKARVETQREDARRTAVIAIRRFTRIAATELPEQAKAFK